MTFSRKYAMLLSISLLPALFVLFWLLPAARLVLAIAFLILTFSITGLVVLEKHKPAYQQGSVSRQEFIRLVLLEMLGILLAMILGGLLGRYIVELATRHIDNDAIRFVAGIVIGLLIGLATGALVRRVWNHFLIAFPQHKL